MLVSGAEDTLVCVWLLSEVLRLPTGPHTDIAAAHTWQGPTLFGAETHAADPADHMLPVGSQVL